jgi:hypothetical protein
MGLEDPVGWELLFPKLFCWHGYRVNQHLSMIVSADIVVAVTMIRDMDVTWDMENPHAP